MRTIIFTLLVSIAFLSNAQIAQQQVKQPTAENSKINQLLDRPVTTQIYAQDTFLQKDLTDYLDFTLALGAEAGNDILRAYFMQPHPSNGTIKKYFQQAATEFNVPVQLLEVIGQVENNWTQTGPTIDQGWGIMHLVKNSYCTTLTEASVLLDVSEQTLKDDARQNIRGAAALISSYAGSSKKQFLKMEDWFPALAQFSGLINEELRNLQARTYLETLKKGVQAPTVWGETITILPCTSIMLPPDNYKNKNTLKGGPKSTDYAPALTSMAPTCNYTSGRTTSIDTWVMHWVGSGTYAGAISWFLSCSSSVSNHFVIRSSDGQITQCVSVSNTAWHCGATGYPLNNPRSIGCEHEATSANPSLWNSTPMLQASATMVCYFKNIYGFPTTQNTCPGICGHNSMPGTSTACPGSLPWSTWYTYFNAACVPAGSCVTCPSYDFSITPSTSWQTSGSSIGASGCKIYRVSVTSGRDYTFQTGCGNGGTASFDTYLTLYNSSCSTLATDDDGCSSPSNTSKITWTATYTGYAYLKVSGYGTNSGTFTLAYSYVAPVICNSCPTYDISISPSTSWQTSNSSIVASGCKLYRASVVSGSDYTFKTGCGDGASADFDTYLTLYDNGCSTLMTDDDGCSSPSNTSTITWTATYSGYVYLKVSGYSTNYGSFTLAYQYATCVASSNPSSAYASLSTVCAGSSTVLNVSGGTLGTGATWMWYSGSCGNSYVGSGSSITITPGSSDTYYVRAEGNCGTTNCVSTYITVNPSVSPSVSITANPSTPVCAGTNITFTPSPSNGGSPTYQWFVNGSYATSGATFSSTNLTNGAQVYCNMASTANCANPVNATSNTITVSINPTITPYVSITSNPQSPVCAGVNVTFTPQPINGGSPTYQWYVNGGYAASGATFSSSNLANGAQIYCVMTSTANCVSPSNATSNTITMTINPTVNPGVTIASNPLSPVCSGDNVTFTPTPVNGGSPSYDWYVNGSSAGSGATFSSSNLTNGAQIYCIMTSTANCVNPVNATSNTVYITVNPTITPTVSITSNPVPPICTGTNVTFSPLPVNGGNPSYQWFLNGNSAGTNSSFSTTTLQNGDQIYCIMTSTATCSNPAAATSNTITISVSAALTPSVTITSNPLSPVCTGTNVTFTPTPVNGGSPTYQWYLNGSYAGSNTTFSSSNLTNGATVFCIMHSTITCVSPANINSDTLTIVVNPLPGIPVVNQVGDSLYSSVSGGNQWLDGNQNIIGGATGVSFWPPVDGTYFLMVTDSNGCSRISQAFNFVHVGIDNYNQVLGEVTLFPNPTTGGKDMSISGIREKTSIAVFNLNGQLILDVVLTKDGAVTLPNLAAAVYIVKIMSESGSIYRKLLVQ